MAENLFLKNAHDRGLIDEREIAFMADVTCTNGNRGRAFCFLNGTILRIYEALGIAETGEEIDSMDLKEAKFLKASSFPLHPYIKLCHGGETYNMQGLTQAKKMIAAIQESCQG